MSSNDEDSNNNERPRTAIIRGANLPDSILAVAMRNLKKRFFIPSSVNTFAGISYPHVMIDNGCSSMLLPFPGEEALRPFANSDYVWKIGGSRGTGSVNSVTLTIAHYHGGAIGQMRLANRLVMELPGLRFHLSTASAQIVVDMGRVGQTGVERLQTFVAQNHPSSERHHVLLGQTLLNTVVSVQVGAAFVIAQVDHIPTAAEIAQVHQVLSGIEKPEGFDDLEDEDHDGDEADWEEYNPWDTLDFDDEPNY